MLRLAGTAAGNGIAVGPVRLPAARILVEERRMRPDRVVAELSAVSTAPSPAPTRRWPRSGRHGRRRRRSAPTSSTPIAPSCKSDEIVDDARRLIRERGVGAEWAVRLVVDELRPRLRAA